MILRAAADDLRHRQADREHARDTFETIRYMRRDPALLERPMLQTVLARHKVPYTAFKYAENTGQMAPIREQAGTFADSIKLWSAA